MKKVNSYSQRSVMSTYQRNLLAYTLVIFTLLLLVSRASGATYHEVIRVVDGDTIVVDYNGKFEKVRLLCVNTPESVHPDKKQNVPMGKVASDYTKERLSGMSVVLEFEGNRQRRTHPHYHIF